MKTVTQLREEYINEFRELQKKRHKERDNFIMLVLLLAYFVDYVETQNDSKMFVVAPFIPKIINIDKPHVVVKAIDEALKGQGKLVEHIKIFKQINEKTLSSLNHIIPQIKEKIKPKGETRRFINLQNDVEIIEQSNAGSLIVNKSILGKTMKQWNTQRDSKVRKTIFHNGIDRQTVEIDDFFQVSDYRARYPADSELPNYDRFNCRCYLTYYN